MTRSRPIQWTLWLRGALLVACALALALVGASCRSVLGVGDGYQDGVDALCSITGRCTGEPTDQCSSRIHGKFDQLGDSAWEAWLGSLGDSKCLEGCKHARGCLDDGLVCSTDVCQNKEECCGFLDGRADCDPKRNLCCKPQGQDCKSDAECCTDAGVCSFVTHTCGGVFCRPIGATCANSFECCTHVCTDSHCADQVCGGIGYECNSNAECCGGFCQRATPTTTGVCADPNCKPEGFPCATAADCCSDLNCYIPEGETTGVCSDCADGLPDGVDCGDDDSCCSKSCDKNFFQCGKQCIEEGSDKVCTTDEDCCDGKCMDGVCHVDCPTSCAVPDDCCSKNCVGGQCAPACKPPTCIHGVCSIGDPLGGCQDCSGMPGCPADANCVKGICDIDPYCCCVSWDSLCVARVYDNQNLCPNGCN